MSRGGEGGNRRISSAAPRKVARSTQVVAALLLALGATCAAVTAAAGRPTRLRLATGSTHVVNAIPGTDSFGGSVSISGNAIVVGDSSKPDGQGAVYVFDRHGVRWRLADTFPGPTGFGFDVAASGPNFAVGSVTGGLAYVYVRDNGDWKRTVLKSPENNDPYFGDGVFLAGTTLIAASPDDGSQAGRAFVFNESGTGWREVAELGGSDSAPGDQFGLPIVATGNNIVVGSGHDGGRIYVFTAEPIGWVQTAELGGQGTRNSGGFGPAVAMSGDTIVVGDPSYANRSGRVYVFGKTDSGWRQSAKLQGRNTVPGDQFGSDVAISGSTVVVGASQSEGLRGTAYLFTRTAGSWKQVAEFNPANTTSDSDFGTSVSISGDTVVVGTAGAGSCSVKYGNGPSRSVPCVPPWNGGAYVYSKTGRSWRLVVTLHRPGT